VVDQNNVEGSAFAKNLRLAALQPLVEGSVSELDGRLNAEIRARIAAGKPLLAGTVNLKDGVLQLPAIGQRFHGLVADVKLTQDSIWVSNVRGRGSSGSFHANANARLRGVTPVAMEAALEIKEDEKLPITLEGETIGDAWGRIEAQYRHQEGTKTNEVHVDVKKLHIDLPEVAPQNIQELSPDEHIRVGFLRSDSKFATIPLQPIEEPKAPSDDKTIVTVKLGEITVEKGQMAEVTLGGSIRAALGERLDVRGQIETRRGTLDISGKQFEIERGVVSFTGGAPDNPTISAVARYDSPAGYTVYAEYTGTAKLGKLRLTADPPLSQDEILTLLMFGTPDGSFGAGSGDSLSTAVGVAGGTAAKGLNRALSDVTDLDVSARIDTSTGAPRPELVVQLTSRVAARVTQALGEPTPGQSPDRTFLTVEFRLTSAWLLSTMVGDKGASAVDVIWRRRY
jgi:translocation and assembly module TamB